MHLSAFTSPVVILWTITFAALLVLLVVLIGRDRAKRFPWFTASIVLIALRLLASRLLFGRLATVPLSFIFVGLAELGLILSLLVVIEVARRAFAGLGRRAWLVGSLAVLVVGCGVLAAWGPWPNWKEIDRHSLLGVMQLMQITAQKGDLLIDLFTIQVGLLIVLVGDRFRAGWRSHLQWIAIGLSTAAIAQAGVEGIWQLIATHTRVHTRAEYEHVLDIHDKLLNANTAVYVLVLIWWIVGLWIDEPCATPVAGSVAESPVPGMPPSD